MKSIKKYFEGITKNTVLLTVASMFSDIATEMLYPIFPIFLTQSLYVSGSVLGMIEGIAQATQNITQGFSGWLSDKIKNRKMVAQVGYFLASVAKPFIGFAGSWQFALGARFLDRLGTGIRSAPRDALIASSVTTEHRGKAFGLEGIGDNLGAFLGPLLTIVLLSLFYINIRTIFYLTFIPGFAAFLLISLVKEKKITVPAKTKLDTNILYFNKSYWIYLAVTAIFGLGNISAAFLILYTRSLGASLVVIIFIYALFNLAAAIISYPAGFLSDVFGRKNILLTGFLFAFSSYLGFAFAHSIFFVGPLFILYGLFQGVFRSVGKALATDFVPESLRANGLGWYNATIGLLQLVASIVIGLLWDYVSHASIFYYGAFFAGAGSVALFALIPAHSSK